MNERAILSEAIATIWESLSDSLGPEWPAFRNTIWALLRQLEDPTAATTETMTKIRAAFAQYPGASAALTKAEQDVTARHPKGGQPSPAVTASKRTRYAIIPVYYATDRNRTGKPEPDRYFGAGRSNDGVSYGITEVSIPDDHRMGELEAPRWWLLEFSKSPEKHVMVLNIEALKVDAFVASVKDRVRLAANHDILVFVHGYNVSFEDAVRRTAQIAYDLNFSGIPIAFSWPSEASIHKYTVDETNVYWSKPHFLAFLELALSSLGATTVHTVAHSMGNRALAEALAEISRTPPRPNRATLRQVVFAAPDIDAQTFHELKDKFQGCAERMTLYASSNDKALEASQLIHKYPRAGDSGDGLVVTNGIDTIDASAVDTSLIGHSYFADNRSVISDLFNLINHGFAPDKRHGLEAVPMGGQRYWRFRS